jgi:KaiC/GvpD/RAD55 family RecA-like ATPase
MGAGSRNVSGDKVSTGVEAFDVRLGGLSPRRYYVLSGAPGSGKTSAALQFLGAGVEAGETAGILTQDDPADLITQAEFLGYDFQTAAERDALLLFRYRLDFQRHFSRAADPGMVFEELKGLLWERVPDRFVIDSVLPLLEGGLAADEGIDAFARFLEEIPCTTYITVPGDLSETFYRRMYSRITTGAAGIFHFEPVTGAARQMTVRKLRQGMAPTEPIRFMIRPGAGIVEDQALNLYEDLPDGLRRRVVLLTMGGRFPPEWVGALEDAYDVVCYEAVERAFGDLASARYGVLLMAIDPWNAEQALELTRELRKAGNGAPILFVSPVRGLRGQTRAQGLRAGGDDFLTDALAPTELLARIDNARARGHRRLTPETIAAAPPYAQPSDENGAYLLMPSDLFRQVLQDHIAGSTHAFFALVLVGAGEMDSSEAWGVLRERLRIKDGDLVAQMEDGQLALYLHDIHRRHAQELLTRLTGETPALADLGGTVVLSYPADRDAIGAWLAGAREVRTEAGAAEASVG